jgi:hypothetical protein
VSRPGLRTQPPPDERSEWPVPEGFSIEWVEADPYHERLVWEYEKYRVCRRQGCKWPVAWALHRSNGWWFYCAEHHYGRKIEDGRLLHQRAVPNTESRSDA